MEDNAKPKLQFHDDGYYVVLFQSIVDNDNVLHGGLYTMCGKPIVLKKWNPSFHLHDEMIIMLLWVRLLGLPVIFKGAKTLSQLATTIGVPLFANDSTTRQAQVSYACILIEVDITKPLLLRYNLKNEKGVIVE